MACIQEIFKSIALEEFSEHTLLLIDNQINYIQNGNADFYRFNQQEHAGFCKAGAPLIGASIIASYAAASFGASGDVAGCQTIADNWEIDQRQESLIEKWARAADLWVDNSEQILIDNFGTPIAQGAEAKVYYRDGDTSVVKERTSIYSTTQKALDALALHKLFVSGNGNECCWFYPR